MGYTFASLAQPRGPFPYSVVVGNRTVNFGAGVLRKAKVPPSWAMRALTSSFVISQTVSATSLGRTMPGAEMSSSTVPSE